MGECGVGRMRDGGDYASAEKSRRAATRRVLDHLFAGDLHAEVRRVAPGRAHLPRRGGYPDLHHLRRLRGPARDARRRGRQGPSERACTPSRQEAEESRSGLEEVNPAAPMDEGDPTVQLGGGAAGQMEEWTQRVPRPPPRQRRPARGTMDGRQGTLVRVEQWRGRCQT